MAKKLQLNWKVYTFSDGDLDKINFPLLCPRCLKKTDLTDYTVTMGNKGNKKKITIPICQSCKKAAVWGLRKQMLIIFAIWAPVSWGLFIVLAKTGFLGRTIEAWGFPWGLILPVVLLGIPLYALCMLISCFIPPKKGLWPIDLKEQFWYLLFENETYVREFTIANTKRLRSVGNETLSPPKWFQKDGNLLI
jgi:hypothetical protein